MISRGPALLRADRCIAVAGAAEDARANPMRTIAKRRRGHLRVFFEKRQHVSDVVQLRDETQRLFLRIPFRQAPRFAPQVVEGVADRQPVLRLLGRQLDLGLQAECRGGSRAALCFNRACLEPFGLFQMLFPRVASAGADQGIGERTHREPVGWGDVDRTF